jgi:hypothetical protein
MTSEVSTVPTHETPIEASTSIPAVTTPEQSVTTVIEQSPTQLTPSTSEVSHPLRSFEHGELLPTELLFTIGRTGRTIDIPLHAFTDADGDLDDGPILDSGGAVITGDYPLNIYGVDERYIDESGDMRPMAVGYHRTSNHASGRDIALIELGNAPDRQGDTLVYNGETYEALDMYLVPDTDSELLNELLGTFYDTKTIFIFACTEVNAGSLGAVDAAVSGSYDITDPYLTDSNKNPNGRILVKYQLVDAAD